MGYTISKDVEEEDSRRIIERLKCKTKEQLIGYIEDNLYFDKNSGTWNIYIDVYEEEIILVGMEK